MTAIAPVRLVPVSAPELSTDARLLDVRTPAEFESNHIEGSVNLPLADLPALASAIATGLRTPLVVVCESGDRARQAADILADRGDGDVAVLDGGMKAWRATGRATVDGKPRWAMDRQVRLVAGSIVLSSILASIKLPKARFLAGAIGGGLTFSALSNTCAMGNALGRLPYNQAARADAADAVRALTG